MPAVFGLVKFLHWKKMVAVAVLVGTAVVQKKLLH